MRAQPKARTIKFSNSSVGFRASERLTETSLDVAERVILRARFVDVGFPGLIAALDRITARGGLTDPANLGERMVQEIAARRRNNGALAA